MTSNAPVKKVPIHLQMPLSSAERSRKYREKLKETNLQKYEDMKKKNAERTKAKKRKIQDMDENKKQETRKKWQDAKRKKKQPIEDNSELVEERSRRCYRSQLTRANQKLQKRNQILFRRNGRLRKIIERQRSQIALLKEKVSDFTDQVVTSTTPLDIQQESNTQTPIIELTPMTKSLRFIEKDLPIISEEAKQLVKKKILQQNVLEESLKETYRDSKSNKERNVLKKLVETQSVKKYNMQNNVRTFLGLKNNIREYRTVKKKRMKTAKEIKAFFERDDVSRMTAGKNEYLTRNKIKKQKRYLLNTLQKLYKIYKDEGGNSSFTTFKRYRPFYIVRPKIGDRNTCACIKHANLAFKTEALKKLGLIPTADLSDLISQIVCNTTSKNCMYSECQVCSGKKLNFNITSEGPETVSWFEWTSKSYEYKKSEQVKVTKRTVKEKKTGLVNTLANTLQNDLVKFKEHYYNIYHQHKQYKETIAELQDNEVVIHCDFSENYVCKMNEEIQSMHFGASKQQITLHTGVAYVKNESPLSFCSLSPSLKHGPEAIWGHLKLVLNYVKENFPIIDRVHFFSDGPTTQYRQKNNFFLFSEKTKEAGFVEATWSFFEASHGKGAADGVGGAIKRNLDGRVTYGDDITDAKSAYEALLKTDTAVKSFYVTEENIEDVKISSPEKIQPVPLTMKLHQVIATEDKNVIKYRQLSCFCSRGNCDCFDAKLHRLKTTKTEKSTKSKLKRIIQNKRNLYVNSSSSNDTDTEIRYVDESDVDSTCIEWINDISTDSDMDMEMNTRNIEDTKQEKKVNNFENVQVEKKSEKTKVTILSEIRNTRENQAYFNLKNISSSTLRAIGLDFNLDSANSKALTTNKSDKENIDIYANPVPSTSAIQKNYYVENTNLNENFKKYTKTETEECKNQINKNSKEEGENYEIEFESMSNKYIIEKTCEDGFKIIKETEEQEKITEERQLYTDDFNLIEKRKLCKDDSKQYKQAEEQKDITGERKVCTSLANVDEEKMTLIQDEHMINYYSINDAILVRYYMRRHWKYYIGFIVKIANEDNEWFYTVKFLKTVTKPELKFTMTKKNDLDSVTSISIVKKVNLCQHYQSSKEYYLSDATDQIYFSKYY